MTDDNDSNWMRHALSLARHGAAVGEVPVGAVLVRDGEMLGQGYNRPVGSHDPSAHAEIVVLREAAGRIGNYRLPGSTLYVTLEPCTMCVGALMHARVDRLVFGAPEPRAGAVCSHLQLLDREHFNHRVNYTGGVLAEECAVLIREFFAERR